MKTIRLITLALAVLGAALLGHGPDSALADGERGTLYIDVGPLTGNTTTAYGAIDVCIGNRTIGATFDIDIIIAGANDLAAPYSILYYNKDVLKVTAYNWTNWKMGPSGLDFGESVPDTDGGFSHTYAQATGVNGDGVLLRVTLQAIANGTSDLTLCTTTGDCPNASDSNADDHFYPEVLVHDPPGNVRVVVGGTCPLTPGPTPAPTVSPTPTLTPTPTSTITPPASATRTLHWGPGWHNETWSGTSTPEEAFACAAGNYAAAYRLVSGGWERHFRDRSDISNMTDLEQYDAFLILVTGDVTCEMPVADPPGGERALDWSVGWQNDGWTGADGMPPEDVFDCADGSYAAAYRLVGGGWERYFPDRADISNMGPLDEYDAFLILITEPVSCSMAIAP